MLLRQAVPAQNSSISWNPVTSGAPSQTTKISLLSIKRAWSPSQLRLHCWCPLVSAGHHQWEPLAIDQWQPSEAAAPSPLQLLLLLYIQLSAQDLAPTSRCSTQINHTLHLSYDSKLFINLQKLECTPCAPVFLFGLPVIYIPLIFWWFFHCLLLGTTVFDSQLGTIVECNSSTNFLAFSISLHKLSIPQGAQPKIL